MAYKPHGIIITKKGDLNASKSAVDFAKKATKNLKPWVSEHYHILREGIGMNRDYIISSEITKRDLIYHHIYGDYRLSLTSLPTGNDVDDIPLQ